MSDEYGNPILGVAMVQVPATEDLPVRSLPTPVYDHLPSNVGNGATGLTREGYFMFFNGQWDQLVTEERR